jgi:hypothetical protein
MTCKRGNEYWGEENRKKSPEKHQFAEKWRTVYIQPVEIECAGIGLEVYWDGIVALVVNFVVFF